MSGFDGDARGNEVIGLPVIAIATQVVNLMHGDGSTLCCHLTLETPAGEFDFILPTEAIPMVKGSFEEYQSELRRVLLGEVEVQSVAIGGE